MLLSPLERWSGRPDLNWGPLGPEPSALPGYATPRKTRLPATGHSNEKRRRLFPGTRNPFPKLVGTARFELATPCTPSKCATRLRYVPILPRRVTRKSHDRPTLVTHHPPLYFYHLRESIVKMDCNSWRIARRCEVGEAGGNRRCCGSARLSELGVRSFRAPEIVKPFV